MTYDKFEYKVNVESDGRIKLPKRVQRVLNVKPGEYIVIGYESEILTVGRPWDSTSDLAKRLASFPGRNRHVTEIPSVGFGQFGVTDSVDERDEDA